METNYSRWKPTTVDGNQSFSFVVFLILILLISSSAGRHFSAYDDHSISSLFLTFNDALGTSLGTSPFYGVYKANYSAFSSSFHDGADLRIFVDFLSPLSDRNFLGTDEKFAILWVEWTSRPCGICVPQFQPFTSASLLATTLPISDTPRSPNALPLSLRTRLAIANAGEQSPRLLQANPTFPTFIDALAFCLLPLHLTAPLKPTIPLFPLSFIGERTLKFCRFLILSYRKFLLKAEKSRDLTPA